MDQRWIVPLGCILVVGSAVLWVSHKPSVTLPQSLLDATKAESVSLAPSADAYRDEQAAWPSKGKTAVKKARREQRATRVKAVIIGVGGVGSHAAIALARSGAEWLRLVDFDQTTLSSLNRHASGTRASVGLSKVATVRDHIARLCGDACKVDARVQLCDVESVAALCEGGDVVLDCIDNVDTKAALVAHCAQTNTPLVVCTGSGARLDAAPMRVTALRESHKDPLIRQIRILLKHNKDVGAASLRCVASDEDPPGQLQPLPDKAESGEVAPSDLAVLPTFRVRIMPVYAPLPCAFGVMMAQQACDVAQPQSAGLPPLPHRLTDRQLGTCMARLSIAHSSTVKVRVDKSVTITKRDVSAAFEQTWAGRHSFDPANKPFRGLIAVLWRATRPIDRDNIVFVTPTEAKKHMTLLRSCNNDETDRLVVIYGAKLVERMDGVLNEAARRLERLKRRVY